MPKKIYFCGAIRGGRSDAGIYGEMIRHISQYGQVLTEHIGDPEVKSDQHLSDRFIHDRDMDWLGESDLIIAEVTQPSLGVGYEIGRAIEMGKPVICLVRNDGDHRLSAMISGCKEITQFNYVHLSDAMDFIDSQLNSK
ncbi:MAG: nucleoside 2-deoxyribosyltransferase [Bacteroidales bacterium]|nr:nucleoside 2-deoxyribosyltransferase [Bacteroidales bacterium]